MIQYINTPNSVLPDLKDYNVIVDIVPVIDNMDNDCLFWEHRNKFKEIKKRIGSISAVKDETNDKLYVSLHCAYRDTGGSTMLVKEGEDWKGDSFKDRINYFNNCILELKKIISSDDKIFSSLILTKDYKMPLKKHMTNISYFVTYIADNIPKDLDWTVHNQLPRRFKTNKLKIEKITDAT